jgi:hypothetical protein
MTVVQEERQSINRRRMDFESYGELSDGLSLLHKELLSISRRRTSVVASLEDTFQNLGTTPLCAKPWIFLSLGVNF